jgi:RNA polymerase sigma-70 factor (ECF subfamily)
VAHSSDHDPDIQSLTVADLIVRLRNSSPAEGSKYCEELIRRFEPLLRGTWHRLAFSSEYQDFVQEVFTQLFKNLSALKDPKAFPGYFRQIVVTVAIGERRKDVANQHVELVEMAALATRIDEDILTKVFITSYLERLSVREQTLLLLEFFHGYTLKDIANQLGLTEENARVIKHRALKSLREMILEDAAGQA